MDASLAGSKPVRYPEHMPFKDLYEKRHYERERLAALRRIWLAEHGPCAWCGTWKKLEVDHVDRRRKVTHRIWSWSEARRKKELARCQALCSKCHKMKSAAERA